MKSLSHEGFQKPSPPNPFPSRSHLDSLLDRTAIVYIPPRTARVLPLPSLPRLPLKVPPHKAEASLLGTAFPPPRSVLRSVRTENYSAHPPGAHSLSWELASHHSQKKPKAVQERSLGNDQHPFPPPAFQSWLDTHSTAT